MKQLLLKTFSKVTELFKTTNIGSILYIPLDAERYVQVQFYNTFSVDTYDAVEMSLVHKQKGSLHCQVTKFKEIFSEFKDLNHLNKIPKTIWKKNNVYEWYGKPTAQDILDLNNEVITYIHMWEDVSVSSNGGRRRVLFTDGMSNDLMLIITDAPKAEIEKYCLYHNICMEEGSHFDTFGTLKCQFYVKELLDSEVDVCPQEDLEILGYDEAYDFGNYTREKVLECIKKEKNARLICIHAGMDGELIIVLSDAPDEVWEEQLRINCEKEHCGEYEKIVNEYFYIEEQGYFVEFPKFDVSDLEWDTSFDQNNYFPEADCPTGLPKSFDGFRTVKLMAGLTPEYEIISTNAPDSVIKAGMSYVNFCSEAGENIENSYAVIEAMGYVVNLIGCQEDFEEDDLKEVVIDAEFDYCTVSHNESEKVSNKKERSMSKS